MTTIGATKKEQFEVLYGVLKSYRDSSLDTVLKVMGFLILAMGWVVTSENARAFIAGDVTVKWASVTVVLATAVLFALFAIRVLRQSRATFRALKALDYMSTDYFRCMVADRFTAIAFIAADFILSIVLCIFIVRL
jgi:hypothetical protein